MGLPSNFLSTNRELAINWFYYLDGSFIGSDCIMIVAIVEKMQYFD